MPADSPNSLAKGPVPPEPGRGTGPHNAPSPDPRDAGQMPPIPLTPEPGDGAPRVIAEDPPASEGDAMHLENDRIQ